MKNTMVKVIFILAMAICISAVVMFPVNATSEFLEPGSIKTPQSSETAEKAQEVAGEILAVVQVVAISVAVIVLIFVAIKYISAAPNDKAEIKKHMVVYVVGAVLLFATSGILGLIQNFAGIFDDNTGGGGGSGSGVTQTQTNPNPSMTQIS